MFAFLTVLALVLALGAIIGIVALVRAYWKGISRHALIAGIVGVVVALGGTIASAVGAAHLAPAASTPAKPAAVTVVDGEEVSSEDLIPNVDAAIDLNQIVVDERFGGYSRYVLRSSWPSLAEVRSHYSGFEDAVSLPLVVDQAWFDAAFDWGPHGQTVTNPDGSTSTVASYAELNSALHARESYLDQLSSMSEQMERFSQVTGSLTHASDTLLNVYQSITDNSDGITRNSAGYVQQMEALNQNVSSLNSIYEAQLKSISMQIEQIEQINAGLNRIKEMYNNSVVDSSVFRSETEKMTQQLMQLNQVYSRLLQAMTINMNTPQQPTYQQPYQQGPMYGQQPMYQQPYK